MKLWLTLSLIFSLQLAHADASSDEPVITADEMEFVEIINQYRQSQRPALVPLKVSKSLQRAARWLSEDMDRLNYCDHVDSLGRDTKPRMQHFGYDFRGGWGENVGLGFPTAQRMFDGWRKSPGHNRNMLKPNIRVMGIANVRGAWTLKVGDFEDELLALE
jgi:uncharacterized protein YkwD